MAQDKARKRPILVVDDDGDIRIALEMLLQYEGYEVWTARDGIAALARLALEKKKGRAPAAILSDLKMPELDGLGLLERVQQLDHSPPLIMISGHADVAIAVEAMQKGAANFLEKPLVDNRVLVTLENTMRSHRLEHENIGLRRQLHQRWELTGPSAATKLLREQVLQAANSSASVLITGENGSGKEVVARNLHLGGTRSAAPFITVNCAAIPAELIESELFGHEKGSFTGAYERRIGHFEAAQGGTLFLDEIGDMPLGAQAKVLRALETHEITRVGASQTIPVDIRVVAATNADLSESVESKSFRLDLFYRLNVIPLHVAPLRERRQDILPLAQTFLEETARRAGRREQQLSQDARDKLLGLDYPGNVRQLKNLLEGATVFSTDTQLEARDLQRILDMGPAMSRPAGAAGKSGQDAYEVETFEEFKDQSEAQFFARKLEQNDGNIKRTAERLGMQRSHLYKKLDRYDLRN
ncbi:MAG: two-component system nitrogen regulation response regulator NtrX [Candidatus Paceibacteria bacterium]|jgi:two-component system nitrogen regulation response regulator NtrX